MEDMMKMDAIQPENREDGNKPDVAEYRKKIEDLSREDLAFMDGYLFAKVTSAKQTVA
jgi:hypothetical protein